MLTADTLTGMNSSYIAITKKIDKVYSALSDDFVLNLYDDYDGYMVVVWSDMYDTKAEFTKDVRKTLKKG